MELSPGILDSIDIAEDKDVMEVLKQASVSEEDIIFESEATEDSEEAEVEEIIEIIEEIEESEESLEDYESNSLSENKEVKITEEEAYEDDVQPDQYDKNCDTEIYTFDEENSMFKSQYTQQETSKNANDSSQRNSSKQVITYDVDEDWQDDDIEHMEEIDEELEQELLDQEAESSQKHGASSDDGKTVNTDAQGYLLQSNKQDSRNMIESGVKIDRSRIVQDYGSNLVNTRNTNINVTQEIVKNAENNLVYTVLGSKKQPTAKQLQAEKVPDAHYIKSTKVLQMEQLDENTIPVEGTIYYEGDNMETLYVAQALDENDQYRYTTDTLIQDEQTWKQTDGETNQNQEEEESSQDQIFLHEDEDGQLYFKDDSGALQPVYLTEDGNYAIAENSDDQDSKESQEQPQDTSRQSDEFIIPEMEMNSNANSKQTAVVPASALQELDNEDSTVTISLIISEDEHGQKRTQVIIPTPDSMKCDICNKSFKTSFQLLRHNRLKHAREEDITTRNFPCDLCPKRYPDQNSLARHRKTHTGDRPFQCLECHKNFPTSTALRRHLTLHNSQSRPLPCIYCGRRFVEKATLIKHEQSHLPTDQRTHTCDVCQKSFLHATDLSLHKKYHDPDKKFDCEVCGREFNRLNNLQRHMMVHQQQGANEEILSCDVCGITYKFMSSLTRHMVTTHMNPEKLRQQAEEQRRKRENNYRRYLENRKMYETQHSGGYNAKRSYHHNARILTGNNDDAA